MIGHISFGMKALGERSTGNLYATFDVAGAGNGKMVKLYEHEIGNDGDRQV
jgi:hypothetical protein